MVQAATEAAETLVDHPGTEGAATIDLQQFCGTDETRPYLMKPFSRDGFTWATNGHILVRVRARPDVPDMDQKLGLEKQFGGYDTATFFKPNLKLPPAPAEFGDCPACSARGYVHDCPHCGCECPKCEGRGNLDLERITSTTIAPKLYALNYIRQILSLPDVEIARVEAEPLLAPLFFRFTGGIGALMPLRDKFLAHVDIETPAADA